MEFRLLGPLEVVEHDRVVALGGGRQRSLLALLLLHANEVVSADRLIDRLWGERPPRTAGKAVQVYVSRLRRELGEARLATRPPGYVLRVDRSERQEGLGRLHRRLFDAPPSPTVLVRRGPRPGGLAPPETATRFGWSLTAGAA